MNIETYTKVKKNLPLECRGRAMAPVKLAKTSWIVFMTNGHCLCAHRTAGPSVSPPPSAPRWTDGQASHPACLATFSLALTLTTQAPSALGASHSHSALSSITLSLRTLPWTLWTPNEQRPLLKDPPDSFLPVSPFTAPLWFFLNSNYVVISQFSSAIPQTQRPEKFKVTTLTGTQPTFAPSLLLILNTNLSRPHSRQPGFSL